MQEVISLLHNVVGLNVVVWTVVAVIEVFTAYITTFGGWDPHSLQLVPANVGLCSCTEELVAANPVDSTNKVRALFPVVLSGVDVTRISGCDAEALVVAAVCIHSWDEQVVLSESITAEAFNLDILASNFGTESICEFTGCCCLVATLSGLTFRCTGAFIVRCEFYSWEGNASELDFGSVRFDVKDGFASQQFTFKLKRYEVWIGCGVCEIVAQSVAITASSSYASALTEVPNLAWLIAAFR